MKDFAKVVYKRKQWKQTRAAYIQHRRSIDGGLCEICHDAPGYIVHHRTELTAQNINDPSVCYSFSNLQYVCHECHNQHHGFFAKGIGEDILFDEDGNPIPPTPPIRK